VIRPRPCWGVVMSSSLVFLAIGVVPATAQSARPKESRVAAPQTGSARATESAWEIEIHGGGILSTRPSKGTTALPPPGAAFPLLLGGSSRRVSSYYFGDGSLLLNQASTALGTIANARISPLDPVLNSAFVERQDGPSVGVRVTRRLTSRVAAEVSIDYQGGRLRTTDAARAGIEASRASFAAVFNGLLNLGGPIISPQVASTATFTGDDQGHRLSTTGALIVSLRKVGALIPYATVGAGVLSSSHEAPNATLTGNYRFLLGGIAPINETDTVLVRSSIDDKALVSMVGGGVRALLSPRFGVRVDVRVQFSGSRGGTFVDATPRVEPGTPLSSLTFSSTPGLRFSNSTQAELQSTLSGPAISDFQTFTGKGIERQVGITAGLFIRFPRAGSAPRAATSQLAPGPATQTRPGRSWDIEVHGGGIFSNNPTSGDNALPPPGESFTTVAGRPSRRVSSYYFGDGALFLNQLNAAFQFLAPGRVTPLDPVLNAVFAERRHGASMGARVGRRLTARVDAELNIDHHVGRLKIRGDATPAIEATRASFITAFNSLIATGGGVVFTNAAVTSVATFDDEKGRRTSATGTLNINLRTAGALIPYATVGAGVVFSSDGAPSVTLVGNYRFNIGTIVPIDDTDTLAVRHVVDDRAFVGVLGGGVKYHVSPRMGIRGDLRVHLGKDGTATSVDATPRVATGTPSGFIPSSTTPGIQFSNISTTQPTFSGPAITDFRTFTSDGKRRELGLTVGVFFRF
jgi:hypothetical protein